MLLHEVRPKVRHRFHGIVCVLLLLGTGSATQAQYGRELLDASTFYTESGYSNTSSYFRSGAFSARGSDPETIDLGRTLTQELSQTDVDISWSDTWLYDGFATFKITGPATGEPYDVTVTFYRRSTAEARVGTSTGSSASAQARELAGASASAEASNGEDFYDQSPVEEQEFQITVEINEQGEGLVSYPHSLALTGSGSAGVGGSFTYMAYASYQLKVTQIEGPEGTSTFF